MSLDLLPPWAAAPLDKWKELTSGDALFQWLQREGKSWDLAPEQAWLDGDPAKGSTFPYAVFWWRSYVNRLSDAPPSGSLSGESPRARAVRRWKVLAEMLWCFDEARRSDLAPSEIDRIALGSRLPEIDEVGFHDFLGDPSRRAASVARAYVWIRSFRAVALSATVEVPIALYDQGKQTGFLGTLTLELMPGGVGEVAAHPGVAFETVLHEEFVDSIGRAWKMALATVPGATRVDGRWQIRRGAPFGSSSPRDFFLETVDGPSASGAAARGWWHVLHERVPDSEVIVLAQVGGNGTSLESVAFIADKVKAVVREGLTPDRHPAFDTIVVVGSRAKREAEAAIGGEPLDPRVVAL